MKPEEFKNILEEAILGNSAAIERILEIYKPLINGSSYIKGKLDEDLQQYILMHIIKNISKFKIWIMSNNYYLCRCC